MESKQDIVEPTVQHVALIGNEHNRGAPVAMTSHLFQEDSNGKVIARLLLPRPTNDPKDPLTWSPWRKDFAFATLSFFVFLSNYITATVTPILFPIVLDFGIDFTKASYLITFNILFLGIGNLFWVPISQKIGKRPVLILCSGIFFCSSIWSAVAQDYGSLLGARIVQGFGASASEALGPSVAADLYFLHERGFRIGFYTFAIGGGSAIGGILAGLVAEANPDNWRMVFWKNVALTGACFLFTILFQSETNFKRPLEYESGEGLDARELPAIRKQARPSWARSLSFTGWFDRESSMMWLWWRPFLTLQYPAVIWGSITYGVTLGWVVLQQTADATAFVEIYGFSEKGIGNLNIASVIGALIGCTVGGAVTDYVCASISKRRGGYFKPEYRLWCLIVPYIFGPIGLLLWGFGLENQWDPYVAIVGTGISYGVLCAVPAVGMTYVVDCYRPVAGETITMLTAFKNTFAFALSFGVSPWITRDGFARVGGYNTLIEGLIFLTTIPMFIYGERAREWSSKFVV